MDWLITSAKHSLSAEQLSKESRQVMDLSVSRHKWIELPSSRNSLLKGLVYFLEYKNKKPETRSRHVGKQTFHCFRDRRANADNDTLSASLSLPHKAAHNVYYVK